MAKATQDLLIRGATVIPMCGDNTPALLDVRIANRRIKEIGAGLKKRPGEKLLKAKGKVLLPGFVQAHVHTCQTLYRGQADNMVLLDWLSKKIWPYEGALSRQTLRASAQLSFAELLLSGTTSVLDMGTVRHTDVIFEEADTFGIRYTGGKTIMDKGRYPGNLNESADEAVKESVRLCKKWSGKDDNRLRYAFSPRFALSCTNKALKGCVREARKHGALLHTHASENVAEVAAVRKQSGKDNVEFLHSIGFSGDDVLLAHGIWLSAKERRILKKTQTRVVHCPSANLKLASGIADIPKLLDDGIPLALGADGAPCNNNLNAFVEMRYAALLHKIKHGPKAIPAQKALELATIDGAKALHLDDVGSIEVGKKADLLLLDLNSINCWPPTDNLFSRIVFAAQTQNVDTVMVDGKILVEGGKLLKTSLKTIMRNSDEALKRVQKQMAR